MVLFEINGKNNEKWKCTPYVHDKKPSVCTPFHRSEGGVDYFWWCTGTGIRLFNDNSSVGWFCVLSQLEGLLMLLPIDRFLCIIGSELERTRGIRLFNYKSSNSAVGLFRVSYCLTGFFASSIICCAISIICLRSLVITRGSYRWTKLSFRFLS